MCLVHFDFNLSKNFDMLLPVCVDTKFMLLLLVPNKTSLNLSK